MMQVLCNANRGTALTAKYLVGNTPETVFHVTIGREYPVFAVSVYRQIGTAPRTLKPATIFSCFWGMMC